MRARVSLFLPFSLLLSACGGGPSAQQDPATAPVVEVESGPEVPPLSAQGSDEDGATEPREAKAVESADVCMQRMREGVGLSGEARRAMPEAAKYGEALAAERAGNLNEARRGYLQVVQHHPQSAYVPLVYFAFGELFIQEGQKDPPKLEFAKQSYLEVLKYPMPENIAWISAHVRLAEIHRQKGDHPQALFSLKKVAEAAAKEPGAPCAASLAAPGRASLVAVYADAGRPSAAFDFFKTASGDKGDERTNALAMVASLAELYVQQQKHDDAATALMSANARFYDAAYCRREGQLVTKLGPSLTATRRDELARAHSLHCVAR
ncbi:MAG TPA: tetratricopeptide repeat protein [Polyangium sp.]|nr:tetratricopeptide repeat protein [Polyangium sp.]